MFFRTFAMAVVLIVGGRCLGEVVASAPEPAAESNTPITITPVPAPVESRGLSPRSPGSPVAAAPEVEPIEAPKAAAAPAPAPTPRATTSTAAAPTAVPLPPPPPQERLPLGASTESTSLAGDAAPPTGSWMFQTFAALAIVISMIFALRFILQRVGGGATAAAHVAPLVEVLARTTIAPKTQVMFLKINQRIVAVCQSPAGMHPLTTFDQPDDMAWILSQIESAKPMSISQGFRQLVHRFDRDYAAESETSPTGPDTGEQYIDRTRDSMSSLLSRLRTLSRGKGN